MSAYRQFIAFTLEPTANITIAPHPRKTGESMPFFDETGRPYRENLESAMMAIRLVSDLPETVVAHRNLVTLARRVASARGTSTEREIPSELFVDLWKAEQEFVTAARREMDLPDIYTPT
ncbi:hypothetical protein [Pseudonocardia acaciae]|uniref:hypothetical protein n=1 Tax=Pseudonocardia acaciae TaxID=551276 RepID=UPI00055DD45E|nr:hypothetical protein [Pseudonocardia acaciae]